MDVTTVKRAARTSDLAEFLAGIGACDDARAWATTQPSAAAAWRNCPYGDWLLYALTQCNLPQRRLVRVLIDCARIQLAAKDARSRKVLDAAERWLRGDDAALEDAVKRYHRYVGAPFLTVGTVVRAMQAADGCRMRSAVRVCLFADPAVRRRCAGIVRKHISWPVARKLMLARQRRDSV